MAKVTQEQVVEYISNLRLGQVNDLIVVLEQTLGVSAAPVSVSTFSTSNPPTPEIIDDPDFDVVLDGFTGKKVDVIKVVRKVTGLGLRDAKALVDEAPSVVREGLPHEEAKALRDTLVAAGGEGPLR